MDELERAVAFPLLREGTAHGHRIEGIAHTDDATNERDRFALEAGRVARAVPVLVVIERDLFGHTEERRGAAHR